MAITAEIRKRPWILIGFVAIALLAFLVNPDSLDQVFGKNPNILGKVNGDDITRDEFNDQVALLQEQSQGQPQKGIEEQAWQTLVQSKLIKQEFEKMGLKLTDEIFWNQLQYDPMFAQNPQNFDAKGNFKAQDVKKEIEALRERGDVAQYNNWLRAKKGIEYRMMARILFSNITNGITANKKEATEVLKQRDEVASIDYVKVDYAAFAAKNPVKVTTADLAAYIAKHPVMFKSQASRNLGLVLFPATASAADDAVALKEINKLYKEGVDNGSGLESFMNTKNDSMFVELNSEAQVKYSFVSEQEVPAEAQSFIKGASAGQVFGPYKSGGKYYVTKLKEKSTATLPKHILIAHKDTDIAKQDKTVTRSKEEAKKIADDIAAQVKADPTKFQQFLSQSADTGSAQQGGTVGWTLPNSNQFVKPFGDFVKSSALGTVGVVETQFGYHVIVIESKMPVYKIANLAKDIKASKDTENKVYTEANTFIQSIQGKSFNDFANAAKKKNYNFQNPKSIQRFQGEIQGLGTDKDQEILVWAFDKKREKGETNIFTTGTGDYVVAYLNGKQEAGIADPESVREQIEPLVKNQLLAKKISEKITSAKASTLDQVAKLFGAAKQSADVNIFSAQVGGAMEPKVAGATFGTAKGKTSKVIEGSTGVYLVVNKGVKVNKQPADVKQMTETMQQQNTQMFGQSLMRSLQDNADIEDYRIEVWDKATQTQ